MLEADGIEFSEEQAQLLFAEPVDADRLLSILDRTTSEFYIRKTDKYTMVAWAKVAPIDDITMERVFMNVFDHQTNTPVFVFELAIYPEQDIRFLSLNLPIMDIMMFQEFLDDAENIDVDYNIFLHMQDNMEIVSSIDWNELEESSDSDDSVVRMDLAQHFADNFHIR